MGSQGVTEAHEFPGETALGYHALSFSDLQRGRANTVRSQRVPLGAAGRGGDLRQYVIRSQQCHQEFVPSWASVIYAPQTRTSNMSQRSRASTGWHPCCGLTTTRHSSSLLSWQGLESLERLLTAPVRMEEMTTGRTPLKEDEAEMAVVESMEGSDRGNGVSTRKPLQLCRHLVPSDGY